MSTGNGKENQPQLPQASAVIRAVSDELSNAANELVDYAGQLVRSGYARKIVLRDQMGKAIIEIPLTVAVAGAAAALVFVPGRRLALIGLAAMLGRLYLTVEPSEEQLLLLPQRGIGRSSSRRKVSSKQD
jgi:hypothetical protein